MGRSWPSALRCRAALEVLLDKLQQNETQEEDSDAKDQVKKRRRVEPPARCSNVPPVDGCQLYMSDIDTLVDEEPTFGPSAMDANDWFRDLSWDALFDADGWANLPDISPYP